MTLVERLRSDAQLKRDGARLIGAKSLDADLLDEAAARIEELERDSKNRGMAVVLAREIIAKNEGRIEELERALCEVCNIIGGPTLTYVPDIENSEWRDRAVRAVNRASAVLLNTANTAAGGSDDDR